MNTEPNEINQTNLSGQPNETEQNIAEQIVSHKKMKPRGGNSPVIGDNGVLTNPGDNSKLSGILLDIHKWGEVDRTDVVALEERFWRFVDYCSQNDIRVTNMLAYYALGITKDDAFAWENGRSRTTTHYNFIKKVKSFCASYRELLGATGKLNPITLVWWQKNYDGLTDKIELIHTPGNPLGSDSDPSTIKRAIEALPEADIE